MSKTQQALPDRLRVVFEDYGVIARTAVPKLDVLDKAIAERKGRWELTKNGDGMALAKVTIGGQAFDGAAEESNMALSIAFAAALKATQSYQRSFMDNPRSEAETAAREFVATATRDDGVESVTLSGAGKAVTLTREDGRRMRNAAVADRVNLVASEGD